MKYNSYLNCVKCYIFDQDGTLYDKENPITKESRRLTKSWVQRSLSLSETEIDVLYKRLQKEFPNPFDGFCSLGLTVEEYHRNVFDTIDVEKYITYDGKLVELLKKIDAPKYVVTFASSQYTYDLLEILGVLPLIDSVHFVSQNIESHNKAECYKRISNISGVQYGNLCVVGDSYDNDVYAATKLGCKTIWISNQHNAQVLSLQSVLELSRYM